MMLEALIKFGTTDYIYVLDLSVRT